MQRKFPVFLTFLLNRVMTKQRSPKTAMISSACDVELVPCRMSRETAKELGSTFAQVWYILGVVRKRRGATLERGPALLCAVVVGSESCRRNALSSCRHTTKAEEQKES